MRISGAYCLYSAYSGAKEQKRSRQRDKQTNRKGYENKPINHQDKNFTLSLALLTTTCSELSPVYFLLWSRVGFHHYTNSAVVLVYTVDTFLNDLSLPSFMMIRKRLRNLLKYDIVIHRITRQSSYRRTTLVSHR